MNHLFRFLSMIFILGFCVVISEAQDFLPPVIPWSGSSQSLIVQKDNSWITPAEESDFRFSPGYDSTLNWLKRLESSTSEIRMVNIGKSDGERDIFMIIASADQNFTPSSLKDSSKPLLLIQAGIHSGEIDGKDAGMMLLRDIFHGTKHSLIEHVNLLFIPILNVDGHERFSKYNRPNQHGPENMGWRTNDRNLNLNRDYGKIDTKEIRAVIQVMNEYDPDLYLDIHVTDGEDYQYDITFGYNASYAYSPNISHWLDEQYSPVVNQSLTGKGHIPGPLVFTMNGRDYSKGLLWFTTPAALSDGYGDLRHLPSVLVENHSLKPFKQRVLGTYILIETTMNILADKYKTLQDAIHEDQNKNPDSITLTWKMPKDVNGTPVPYDTIQFKGIKNRIHQSEISGTDYVEWLGKPVTLNLPVYLNYLPDIVVYRPEAYWIPAAWDDVIKRLRLHGIQMETIEKTETLPLEFYRIDQPEIMNVPNEGHIMVKGRPVAEKRNEKFLPGSVRIPTDQPLGDLAILLLEPGSDQSFFQWGFFMPIFSRTEYIEGYMIEPIAADMLKKSLELKKEFEEKLKKSPEFANNPKQRLQWFYEKTPYYDEKYLLYPVGIER